VVDLGTNELVVDVPHTGQGLFGQRSGLRRGGVGPSLYGVARAGDHHADTGLANDPSPVGTQLLGTQTDDADIPAGPAEFALFHDEGPLS
jgi:hypothetical protein